MDEDLKKQSWFINTKATLFINVAFFVLLAIVTKNDNAFIIFSVAVGIFLLFSLIRDRFKFSIKSNLYHIYLFCWAVFCCCSSIWAQESQYYANARGKYAFEILVLMLILYNSLKKQNKVLDILLKSIMYGGFIVLIYVAYKYGLIFLYDLVIKNSRIDSDVINSNILGMIAANSIIISLYFCMFKKEYLSVFFIIPALLMIIISGSRKAVVAVIIGAFSILFLKQIKLDHIGKSLIKILSLIVLIFGISITILNLPFMKGLNRRFDDFFLMFQGRARVGGSSWLRLEYTKLGIRLFKNNPILGIGMDNARMVTKREYAHRAYLHNNYIEILADGGIVGFITYYWLYLYFLFYFFVYFKSLKPELMICLVLIIVKLIMDVGCVSYEQASTYYNFLLWSFMVRDLKAGHINHVCYEKNTK